MSQTIFAPKLTQADSAPVHKPEYDDVATVDTAPADQTNTWLIGIARWVVIGFAGLLPIFFIPGLWGSLGFQKVLLAMVAVGGVSILLALLSLRTRTVSTVLPLSLLIFFGVVATAVVSALFSPNWNEAFRGSLVETQTVAFLALLGGVMAIGLVMQYAKRAMYRFFVVLMTGGLLLLTYVSIRLLAGPILPFNSFLDATSSPVGTFNDLAVFAGLIVLLSLVALIQLRLTTGVKALVSVATIAALFVLAAVNFFYVWLIVGFFSLLVLLYLISYDTLFRYGDAAPSKYTPSRLAIIVTAVVCVVSAGFVVAGENIGGIVGEQLEISYLEVRPSLGATTDILQATYTEDLFFGAGPNQFESSWRSFKDTSINQTIFWNTDFRAGSGYIPTMFINLGLVGGLLLIAFHAWYLWNGALMLLRPTNPDSFWYFVGLVSFTGAVFLWGMSYVYVPGATLLLLAALLTGISFAARGMLLPERMKVITLATNHKRGFALMALVIMLISSVMGAWFTVGKQYSAHATFAQAQATQTDVSAIDQAASLAYQLYPDDQFLIVRAQIALFEMNEILALSEPSESDQQRFITVSTQGLAFAEAAVAEASDNPAHLLILASLYNNLAIVGIEGAAERVQTAIATARALDPKNPIYDFVTAQFAVNRNDLESVRPALLRALEQKNNFSEALNLLAQLDIQEGNTEAAITTTQAIIRLEPNNATRYYQLGILQTAAENLTAAATAYREALRIDPDFANARYSLALLQINDGELDAALTSLLSLQAANADNVELQQLITSLQNGTLPDINANPSSVSEVEPVVSEDNVTSQIAPESDLLTPLNTVGSSASTPVPMGSESQESIGLPEEPTATE